MEARAGLLVGLLLCGCAAPRTGANSTEATARCGEQIPEEIAAAPTFTPFHEGPELIDRSWFLSTLQEEMAAVAEPVETRPVEVWVLVDATGCTAAVRLESSSGVAAIDRIVESRWARAEWTRPLLRYGRERLREKAVPVWIKETVVLGAT